MSTPHAARPTFTKALLLVGAVLTMSLSGQALAQGPEPVKHTPEVEPTKVIPVMPMVMPQIDISGPRVNVIIVLRDQPFDRVAASVKEKYKAQLEGLRHQIEAATIQTKGVQRATRQEEKDAVRAVKPLDSARAQQARVWLKEMDATKMRMRQEITSLSLPSLAASQESLVKYIQSAGGTVLNRMITVNAVAAILPTDQLQSVRIRPDVARVVANEETYSTLDTSTGSIYASTFWNAGYSGGVWDIGVVDSGIDSSHPAFSTHPLYQARFGTTADAAPTPTNCPGWNPSDLDPTTDDVNGHGTHVAAIVASSDTTYRGVANGLNSIINVKAGFDCDGSDGGGASMYSADAMQGVDWSYNSAGDDADVLNLSYGGPSVDDYPEYARFWDGVVNGIDMPVSISAGNDGPDTGTVGSPCIAYNVICVANLDDRGNTDRSDDIIANSSSRGPTPNGRRKPDLTAPGTNINSADNNWEEWIGGLHPDWVSMTGTSMAAPHIAGVLVLLMDYGIYNPMAQKAVLINTAQDLGSASWDDAYGWGYIDLSHAYFHLDDYFLDSVTYTAPDFKFYKGSVYNGELATLVWNRRATYNGSSYPSAPPSLSDLDLYLFDETVGATVSSSLSGINNVEQVKANADYPSVVLKVEAWGSFDGTTSESFALATEEGFSPANGPALAISAANHTAGMDQPFIVSTMVANNGDLDAHSVQVTLSLPPGLTLVSGSNPQNLGTIPDGQSKTSTWTLQASQVGNLTAQVGVNSNSYEETFSASGSIPISVSGQALGMAVTTAGFDNIGSVLTQMGRTWTPISDADMGNYALLNQYSVVFANCNVYGESYANSAATSLRQFVQNGGSLYASDWAYAYIKAAFPGYVSFYDSPKIGSAQYVTANITDPGLANYINPAAPPSTVSINYNLGVWVPVKDVAAGVNVHLRGSYSTYASYGSVSADIKSHSALPPVSRAASGPLAWETNKPLVASFQPFPNGGRVIYTSFHNEPQQTDIEKKLVEYLVLVPSTSPQQQQVKQVLATQGVGTSRLDINTINQGQTTSLFSFTTRGVSKLVFALGWSGSTLRLSVYRPNGALYQQAEGSASPILVAIPNAQSGTWKYQVTALSVPYSNYPYVVGIGEPINVYLPGVFKNP